MSYVVLARKYRPHSFEEMVGQEHVVRALTNALEQQRLHHAYLFTGTRGIGKTTVSRILAKSLNCTGADGTGGITARPCGQCSACTEIDADRYIDYIELDAASNRGIDEVRDLLERAAYKPSIGRFKVFMIDEAHQLTKESFNALLKTLEEPPEYLKFVLATTDPDKMLPTVLSRCLQFNLRPMAPEVVHGYLQTVLQAENVATDAGSLRLLSRAARGSMRDALSLTDQAIAYGAGQLTEGVVRAMLGTVDRSHASSLVRSLAQRDGVGLLAGVDALRGRGLSAAGTLEEMATLLQQMAIEQAVPGALDVHDPESAEARELVALLPRDETQLLYSIVLHGRGELGLASDEYGALTMVLLRLLAFPSAAVQPSAAAPAAAPVARPTSAAAVPAAAPAATPTSMSTSALQAPREARSSIVPRPAPPAANATVASARPAGLDRPAAAVQRPAVPARPVPPQRSTEPPAERARSSAGQEPPPWLDDMPPADEDGPVATLGRADAVAVAATASATTIARPAQPLAQVQARAPLQREGHVAARQQGQGQQQEQSQQQTQRPMEVREPSPAPLTSAAPASIEVQRTPLGDRWAGVVASLSERGAISALVRELAMQAELVAVTPQGEGEVWQLRVERESLRADAMRNKLQAALATVLQPAPQLDLVAGVAQDSPARRDAAERERRQRAAEDTIRNDPLVRELMAQFKTARIVPGSIKPV